MGESLAETKVAIIRQELSMAQSSMDKYDDIIFKIRGWEVTIWSALMVVFFQSGKSLVLLIAVVAPLMIWSFDTLYKSFRQSYRARREKISSYLSSENFEKEFKSGKISFKSPVNREYVTEEFMTYFLEPHVFLIHVLLSVVAGAMYFLLM